MARLLKSLLCHFTLPSKPVCMPVLYTPLNFSAHLSTLPCLTAGRDLGSNQMLIPFCEYCYCKGCPCPGGSEPHLTEPWMGADLEGRLAMDLSLAFCHPIFNLTKARSWNWLLACSKSQFKKNDHECLDTFFQRHLGKIPEMNEQRIGTQGQTCKVSGMCQFLLLAAG